ncbi:protein GVQW3-like [Octopus bimaculoides]|uniref:protein GVQW3-like n=1 Tax=Octopus bimaculoides TaxID=37653 RepID=UPI0022E48D59|nr:protein GVQW3-like [Octopus bimaculoides]
MTLQFYIQCKKWGAELRRERDNLEDDPRSGRLATSTTEDNIDHIHRLINNRQLTINQIANAFNISCASVENILCNELGIMKASIWWVPRLLTSDEKRTRLITSRQNMTYCFRQIRLASLNVSKAGMSVGFITLR